jgi:hypothetical protein
MFGIELSPITASTDITATYAGLPCQVLVAANVVWPYGDQRGMLVLLCIVPTSATFTGNQFVVTFNNGPSYIEFYGGFMSVALYVDPSTALVPALSTGAGSVIAPADWSQAMPAVSGIVNDMLVSYSYVVSSASRLLTATAANSFTIESPSGGLGGAGIPCGCAWRQLTGSETDTLTWAFASPTTISSQIAYGVAIDLLALIPPPPPPPPPLTGGSVYSGFRLAQAFAPVMLSNAGSINPKVYMPISDTTVRAK